MKCISILLLLIISSAPGETANEVPGGFVVDVWSRAGHQGYKTRAELQVGECFSQLPPSFSSGIQSIDTAGFCVEAFDGPDCEPLHVQSIFIMPGSPRHDDLT